MKKTICMVYLIILSFLCVSCSTTIIEKPTDGDLEYWLGEKVDNVDWNGHDQITGVFGGKEYLDKRYKGVLDEDGNVVHPEYYVSYTVTSYPDYSSKTKAVTSIDITDPNITIYGLSLNSSFEEIENKMKELGFTQKTSESFRFTRGKVIFSFLNKAIFIRVEVTNKRGISF